MQDIGAKEKQELGVVLSESGFSGYLTIKDIIPVLESLYEKVLVAASHNARLLILDEPTAGLDVVARDELLEILREFMEQDENRAILISSHISGDLETLCDDVYLIHEGKVILHEETDVLLSDYALMKADEGQYAAMDKQYLLRVRKESFGYTCLTDQKQYYMENYPKLVIEKGTIDGVITMMIRGEAI